MFLMSTGLGGAGAAPMEPRQGSRRKSREEERTLRTLGSVFMTLTLGKMEKTCSKTFITLTTSRQVWSPDKRFYSNNKANISVRIKIMT